MTTLRENINGLLSEKLSLVSKLTDGAKVTKNSVVNDLPSIDTVKEQTAIQDVKAPQSTNGLFGFESDKTDVKEAGILGQNTDESSFMERIKQDTFGSVQVEFEEDGGIQTKSVEVPHALAGHLSQEELAKMSAKDKLRFEELIKKLTTKGVVESVHQIDQAQLIQVEKVQGQNAQKTMLKEIGLRGIVENINRVIGGKLGAFKTSIPKRSEKESFEKSSIDVLKEADSLDQVSI